MKKIVAILLAAMMLLSATAVFAEAPAEPQEIKLGQVVCYLHGNGFAVVTAVIQGETICLAKIDEFQFLGNREDLEAVGVPVKDGTFSQTNAETGAVTVLGSKRVNSDLYSLNMQRAGSKVQIAANYDAIEKFVVGKTIAQLEAAVDVEGFADMVTGATLKDTPNYVKGIIAAAKAAHAQYAVHGYNVGNTGTYTLWNTTGEDIVGIYIEDLVSGWKSPNYAAAPLHTVGSENDNNPYIITRTVTEEEAGTHMRIWAVTESGKTIGFPDGTDREGSGGLSIETANINFMNPDVVTTATQIDWKEPEQ